MIKTHEIEHWLTIVRKSPEQLLWELANGETSFEDFQSLVTAHAEETRLRDPEAAVLKDLLWESPLYEREALALAAIQSAYN